MTTVATSMASSAAPEASTNMAHKDPIRKGPVGPNTDYTHPGSPGQPGSGHG